MMADVWANGMGTGFYFLLVKKEGQKEGMGG